MQKAHRCVTKQSCGPVHAVPMTLCLHHRCSIGSMAPQSNGCAGPMQEIGLPTTKQDTTPRLPAATMRFTSWFVRDKVSLATPKEPSLSRSRNLHGLLSGLVCYPFCHTLRTCTCTGTRINLRARAAAPGNSVSYSSTCLDAKKGRGGHFG